jgi:hypothetical protein
MASVRKHFAPYADTRIYFSLRFDVRRLGTLALSAPMSALNALVSRATGTGGYPIALVRKAQAGPAASP